MHLDGCVEVEAAYYGARRRGRSGRAAKVQWGSRCTFASSILKVASCCGSTGPASGLDIGSEKVREFLESGHPLSLWSCRGEPVGPGNQHRYTPATPSIACKARWACAVYWASSPWPRSFGHRRCLTDACRDRTRSTALSRYLATPPRTVPLTASQYPPCGSREIMRIRLQNKRSKKNDPSNSLIRRFEQLRLGGSGPYRQAASAEPMQAHGAYRSLLARRGERRPSHAASKQSFVTRRRRSTVSTSASTKR